MTGGVADLVEALRAQTRECVLVVFAAYPRDSRLADRDLEGAAIDRMLLALGGGDSRAFRVMHAEGAMLMSRACDTLQRVQVSCRDAASPNVEVRAVIVEFQGPRGGEWLDEVLGEFGLRANFGSFNRDSTKRIVDGVWLSDK
jgi:hypothetical protein